MLRLLLCTLLVCSAWSAVANELERADSALMRGDYAAAIEILETLSTEGNASAMTVLASLYHRGEGVQRDVDKAVELYLVAAELGQSEAQFNLGNMYLLGEGVPQDESWALSFYRLAAKQGHPLAAQNMRELHRANGDAEVAEPATVARPRQLAPELPLTSRPPAGGSSADLSVAAKPSAPLAREAEAIPKPKPQVPRSATDTADRIALPSDADPVAPEAPIVTLAPVATRVEAPAQALTSDQSAALRLAKAHGITVDIDSEGVSTPATGAAVTTPVVPAVPAATAPVSAAGSGDLAARFERAERMLALENFDPAIAELTALAAAGHAGSAWRLAALHARGQGVPQDEDATLRWQERAAELGHVEAQFELGEKYARGLGVAPDEAMAITYYRDAARGGHVQAREKLRAIYNAAGLPMPDLVRRRAPVAITVPVTERPVQEPAAAPASLASSSTVSRRDPIENTTAEMAQTVPTVTARAANGGVIATGGAITAAKPATPLAKDTNQGPGAPAAQTEMLAPVAAAATSRAAVPQPRLTPDAIVNHPEWIHPPAAATADIAPAPPANHEVVPGSVLATAGNSVTAPNASVRSTVAPGYSGGAAEPNRSSNADDDLTFMPPVAADKITDVRPDAERLETVAQTPGATDETATTAASADASVVAATSPGTRAAALATGTVVGATSDVAAGKRALAGGDLTGAAEIFSRLAEAGDAEAQAHIGYMYYVGEGVALDLARAVNWYRRAAVQGNRDAQYNLAVAYAFGEGVGQSDDEAAIWYRRAAEQGSAIAQYSLGMSYALGEGVPQDDVEATKWYRAAAEQDYAAAQYNLGYSYRTGRGVAADEAEAIRWFEAAAANGHASAQYSLGYMYRSGRGVERDVDEAIKWYRLAAAQGHPDARADLASLNPDS